jgi:hypothetical protein
MAREWQVEDPSAVKPIGTTVKKASNKEVETDVLGRRGRYRLKWVE